MEALREAVKTVTSELAELYEDQVVALNTRDKERENELEERIQELQLYRDHLEEKINEEHSKEPKIRQGPEISISYVSSWNVELTEEEIACIGLYGGIWNKRVGVTSCLLVIPSPGVFFQILEGEEETVDALFRKIAQNPQHCNVTLLLKEKITQRRFEKWPLRIRMLNDVDSKLHIPLTHVINCVLAANTVSHMYTPQSVAEQLARGDDPLATVGTKEEWVVGFVGVRDMTAGSVKHLCDVGHATPALALMDTASLIAHTAHQHVEKAGGVCYPWMGNGMLIAMPAAQATAAVECALKITADVGAVIDPCPCCIGLDAGMIFSTVCGRGNDDLMQAVFGAPVTGAQEVMQEACRCAGCSILLSSACYRMVSKIDHTYTALVNCEKEWLYGVA